MQSSITSAMRPYFPALLLFSATACIGDPVWQHQGQITDCATSKPLAGVEVGLTVGSARNEQRAASTSDSGGAYALNVIADHHLPAVLRFSKPGYEERTLRLSNERDFRKQPEQACLTPTRAAP